MNAPEERIFKFCLKHGYDIQYGDIQTAFIKQNKAVLDELGLDKKKKL